MEQEKITNQITIDFFKNKVEEIKQIPIQDRLATLDNYIDNECDKISRALKSRLIAERKQAILELLQKEQEQQNKINELEQKIKGYDKDMEQIEFLRKLKRK